MTFEIQNDHRHGWLTLEESASLLRAIFPAYPLITPCRKAPPKNEWFRYNYLGGASTSLAGGSRVYHGGRGIHGAQKELFPRSPQGSPVQELGA
jgi:hypothetical protein